MHACVCVHVYVHVCVCVCVCVVVCVCVCVHVPTTVSIPQESADATFYGQQLQRRMRVHGGVRTHDLQDEPVVDVPSLEQRLEARQSLMEEEREEERRMRRISGQVP